MKHIRGPLLTVLTVGVACLAGRSMAAPKFIPQCSPEFRRPQSAIIMVRLDESGDPDAILLESLSKVSKETPLQRAKIISERFQRLTQSDPEWWKHASKVLKSGTVNNETVISVEDPDAQAGTAPLFILTCDEITARHYKVPKQLLADELIEIIQNKLNPNTRYDLSGKAYAELKIAQRRTRAGDARVEGDIRFKDGDNEGALKKYQEALELAPDDVLSLEAQIEVYKAQGGMQDRIDEINRRLLDLNPAVDFREQGQLAAHDKDWKSAISLYKKAIAQAPWCLTFQILLYDTYIEASMPSPERLKASDVITVPENKAENITEGVVIPDESGQEGAVVLHDKDHTVITHKALSVLDGIIKNYESDKGLPSWGQEFAQRQRKIYDDMQKLALGAKH